jgi:hypothetical protein
VLCGSGGCAPPANAQSRGKLAVQKRTRDASGCAAVRAAARGARARNAAGVLHWGSAAGAHATRCCALRSARGGGNAEEGPSCAWSHGVSRCAAAPAPRAHARARA